MFGPGNLHLPAELFLQILQDPDLTWVGFLRFGAVNQEWRSFIYGTNDIRKIMYLPPLRKSGRIQEAGSMSFNARVTGNIRIPIKAYVDDLGYARENFPAVTEMKAHLINQGRAPETLTNTAWDVIPIHPLLDEFRTESGPSQLALSYQILRHFSRAKFISPTASWRRLLITQSAIGRIQLSVDAYRCDKPLMQSAINRIQLSVDAYRRNEALYERYKIMPQVEFNVVNRYGVTFGDIVNALWQTVLPRNIGLVPDDGSCTGKVNVSGEHECDCYNRAWPIEQGHTYQAQRWAKAKERKKASLERAEARAVAREERQAAKRKAEEQGRQMAQDKGKDWERGQRRLRETNGKFRKRVE